MWDESVVTNAGAALLERWATGGTLIIDGATAGTGTVPAVALCNAKALVDERQTLSITQTRATEGGMQYTMQFSAPEEGYTCNQIGLWAHLEDEPLTLMTIYQDAQGFVLPDKADMPDFVYAFYAVVQMSNTGNLQVTIDGSAYARVEQVTQSVADLEERMQEALDGKSDEGHTHTAAEVGAAAENHTHDYAAANHTHTAADIGAAAASHTHTVAEVGAVKKSGDTMTGTLNVIGSGTCVSNVNPDTSTEMLMRAYEKFGMIACAARDKNGRYRAIYVSADNVTMDWIARVVTNMPGDVDAAGTWTSFRLYHSGMETPIPVIHGGIGTNAKGATACDNIGALYNNPSSLWRLIDVLTPNKGDWMLERKVTAVQEGSNGCIGIDIANDAMYRTNRKEDGTYRGYKVYDTGNKPTAEDVGAATVGHTHTAADVGAAAVGHTHTAADVGAAAASHTHTAASVGAQAALGFTPVQQGGGVGQGNNKVKLGWDGSALKATVDSTDLGAFRFGSNVQLLWQSTNGGATFPAQTITLSKSPILIVIVCESSTASNEQGQLSTTIARKNGYGFCYVQQLIADPRYTNFRRFAYGTNNTVSFEGGYKMVNGTTPTADNNACVPIAIYGIMD